MIQKFLQFQDTFINCGLKLWAFFRGSKYRKTYPSDTDTAHGLHAQVSHTCLIFTCYIKCWLCLFYPFGGTTLSIKLQGSQKQNATNDVSSEGSRFSYIRITSPMKSRFFLGLSPLQSIKSIDFSGCIMPWPQKDVSRPKENGQSSRYSANEKKILAGECKYSH